MKKRLFAAICAAMLALSGCGKQALGSSDAGKSEISIAEPEPPVVCNHRFRQYCEPACASTYWVEERCACCGVPNGVGFETGPDIHNYVDTVVSYGNCSEPAVISHICSGCGASLPDTTGSSESAAKDHDYQPYSGSEIDGEYHIAITYDCDRCTRCGKEINRVQTGCDLIVPEPAPTKELTDERQDIH